MTSDHTASTHGRQGDVDALRCFAMTAVIAQHAGLLPCGWIGVWLFYVISGFVVTSALLSRPVGSPGPWLRDFYIRRVARIVPLYAAYVLIGFALLAALGDVQWKTLALLMAFLGNFAEMNGLGEFKGWPTGHLWTVSVEMQFYLVFGLAFVFLSKRQLVALLLTFVLLAPFVRAIEGGILSHFVTSENLIAYIVYATPIAHFDAFAAGALLALFPARLLNPKAASRLFGLGVAAVALYCLVYAGVNVVVRHDHGFSIFRRLISGTLYGEGREIWLYSAIMLLNAGVVAWSATGAAPWRRITQLRFIQHVGVISYGGYILHALGLTLAGSLVGLVLGHRFALSIPARVLFFILGWTLAVAAAELSYRFLERPIIRATNLRLKKRAEVEALPAPAG